MRNTSTKAGDNDTLMRIFADTMDLVVAEGLLGCALGQLSLPELELLKEHVNAAVEGIYAEASLDRASSVEAANDDPSTAWVFCGQSCHGNPGRGGWGTIIVFSTGEKRKLAGSLLGTTSNQMTLHAVIAALRGAGRCKHVVVTTNNTYARDGFSNLPKWKAACWRRTSGKPVLNRKLWEQLDELLSGRHVEWQEPTGNPLEQEAASLALAARNGR